MRQAWPSYLRELLRLRVLLRLPLREPPRFVVLRDLLAPDVRFELARRPAVPVREVALLPERVERFAPPRLDVVLRAVAARFLPPLAPAFFAFFRAAGRRRAAFAELPEPPFIPPPVSLFTVAQARDSAVFSEAPFFS